jgi:periplasmic copper chaperone A
MRRTGTVLPAAALMAALAGLTGCSAAAHTGPELKVSGAYVPQPALADMAAGYLTVTNTGDTAATLTSVTSDLAGDITMHTTRNDRMTEVNSFTVPAGGRLTLGLGGSHLMLTDLAHRPVVGDAVALELHFTKGFGKEKTLDVRAAVKPMSYRPKD